VSNTEFYNNVAFATPRTNFLDNGIPNTNSAFGVFASGTDLYSNLRVRNNIFQATSPNSPWVITAVPGLNGTLPVFQGNNYFTTGDLAGNARTLINFNGVGYDTIAAFRAATQQETVNGVPVGSDANPALVNPGTAGVVDNPAQLTSALQGYRLSSTSPILGTGVDLSATFGTNVGSSDFFGLALPTGRNRTPNPGADQSSGVLSPPVDPNPGAATAAFLVGSGEANVIQVRNAGGAVISSFAGLPEGTTAGSRVASGDFNGDGIPDYAIGSGPGVRAIVRVINGANNTELFRINPYDNFIGGVYVAAGDLNGDGFDDLAITPDEGGGPRVRTFSGNGFGTLFPDFFGIDDANFRGGARIAIGDVNGDRIGDLIVAAGFGGGPRVTAFNSLTLRNAISDGPFARAAILYNLFVFEDTLRNGTFISADDFNGDGIAELVAGAGPGGGPRVRILAGADLLQASRQRELASFFAGDPNNRSGVPIVARDLNRDGQPDIVAGAGAGAASRLTAYTGQSALSGGGTTLFTSDPFPGSLGGVFVG
jgi:hypothetical protein